MSKHVNLTLRPKPSKAADSWVEAPPKRPPPPKGKIKRLTIDIDSELHTRLRTHCVLSDIYISDFLRGVVRDVLDRDTARSITESSSI